MSRRRHCGFKAREAAADAAFETTQFCSVVVGGIAAVGAAASNAYASNKASKSADKATAAQSAIAGEQTALSREALDWEKQKYKDETPAREAAAAREREISDAQLGAMQLAIAQGKDYDAYNKETFRPVEKGLVADAVAYDTPMRRAAAAESAMSGVDSSAAAINSARNRELGRAGIAPGSTKAMALAQDSAVSQSKVRAAAGTAAVNSVEQQGVARRMDAASLGRGLPSAQATQQQIATSAGNSSAGTAMQSLIATQSGKSDVMAGYGTAQSGLSSAGGMYSGIARTQAQQAAQYAQQAGSAISAGVSSGGFKALGSFFSDEEIKSNTDQPADTAKALDEIVATPVKEGWTYEPAKGGPDDGGQPHIGPMAQTVQRISGDQAAPGGKQISIVDELGRMRAAIQELDKRQGGGKRRTMASTERAAA